MDIDTFNVAFQRLGNQALEDVAWSENVSAPTSAEGFAAEAIYVICNSGMKFEIARRIYDKVMVVLRHGESAAVAFGHEGKAGAIDHIWQSRDELFREFNRTPECDRIEWLGELPWIGDITKFHLAKNFGVDCVKPDVHLARLAKACDTDPDALCDRLADATGYRKATIDLIVWRACATGVIDSHTGALLPPAKPEPVQAALAV